MQFNSVDFMIFFPVVLAFYFVMPKKLRTIWLLIASYFFYMSWNAVYALLIGGSTLVTYVSGLLLSKLETSKGKKLVMVFCIVINLSILALFKYGNFFIDSMNQVLRHINVVAVPGRLNLLLPVGISFYTFQALGYIIDVYRGDVLVERNFIRYALFVSFFPQLVAGPIERSKNLLNQMRNIENIALFNARRIASGAIMMVWGYFMKMVIADRMSILVDTVFNDYRMYGSAELFLATTGFAIQIYCDFASYSIIALGAARIMGFELMENFNAPYFAQSIKEFWSRWHISLSTWFRDYLYIPLGGNRKGKVRKYLNLMIVFLVSGLWHGANFTFVVWGAIHGFFQVVSDCTRGFFIKLNERLKIKTDVFSFKLLRILVTFLMVSFAWIFFRSDSISDALRFIKRMFDRPTPWNFFNGEIYNLGLDRVEMNVLLISVVILLLVDLLKYLKNKTLDAFLFEQNIWFEWFVIIGLIVMIYVFGEYGPSFDAKQFIYFQF
ncbi:MAG: MBOAT family protein [Lachnospiraceae bacterium]|nr:MBOAT family protein [Lachnospiraceae bacterium]